MNDQSLFASDKKNESAINLTELKSLADTDSQILTFTCTPWGSGQRMGIDRDMDGTLDGDEV